MNIFFIFYYFLSIIIYLFSLPFLIFISFKKKYKKSIPARFFLYKNPPFKEKNYYFHACSLGENRAISPFVKELNANVSVITETGYNEAKKYAKEVRFLPFEIFIPFWFKKCKNLIVVEAELWYMLFFIGKKKCNKTILLNARISKKSYPKYLKFKWFYKKIFENIDLVLAQSENDKNRLKSLGAKNIKVIGNIKTYINPTITTQYIKQKPLIVLASTHKNEEEILLNQIKDLKDFQIVVVPRHPERFDEVYEIMKRFGNPVRLSEKLKVKSEKFKLDDDFILFDKMGELINLYSIADVVILGGSFVDNVGGHNPIEAAYFNVPIISGKYYFNQEALYNEVENIYITHIEDIPKLLNSNLKPTFIKNRVDLKKIIDIIKESDVL